MSATRRNTHLSTLAVLIPVFAGTTIAQVVPAPPGVVVTEHGTVDLAVQDADLSQVLEMLAIQGRRNILAGSEVSATVTANLFNVTFEEALDAILRVNGYGYVEEGNFIYVYTAEALAGLEQGAAGMAHRIFVLSHLAAEDAEAMIAPLLSDDGESAHVGDVDSGFDPDTRDGGADSYAFTPKLVVHDHPENIEAIASLLHELDTPPDQVLVEATILQTDVDEDNAFGVDFTALSHLSFEALTGGPLSAASDLISGDVVTSDAVAATGTVGNTSQGSAGLKIGVIRDGVGAFLRVLDEVTDTTVLARPKVLCLNRQRAEVLIGRRVGYLSTTQSDATSTTTQTVEFLDTGIHLVFRPFISPGGMIRMEIYPRVSEASPQQVTTIQQQQVTIPDEITQELTTNIRVHDGETIVLGGLFREKTQITRRHIPLLGDVPLIGPLFRGHDNAVEREEIIFMLTPRIVRDTRLLEPGDAGSSRRSDVQVGSRPGLLPVSQARITEGYGRRAITAHRDGDLSSARYWADLALALDPDQPTLLGVRRTADEAGAIGRVQERLARELAILAADDGVRPETGEDHAASGDVPSELPMVVQELDPR